MNADEGDLLDRMNGIYGTPSPALIGGASRIARCGLFAQSSFSFFELPLGFVADGSE